MRYLVGFVLALVLTGSPLSGSAQGELEGVPPAESSPEEPALQLELNDAGVQVAAQPPTTPDGKTLEEVERRVRRAKIGLGVSGAVYGAGLGLVYAGLACASNTPAGETAEDRCYGFYLGGAMIQLGGLVGMIMSGIRLAKYKRDRLWLRQAQQGNAPRVQWDLARSRLVFCRLSGEEIRIDRLLRE